VPLRQITWRNYPVIRRMARHLLVAQVARPDLLAPDDGSGQGHGQPP